MLRKALRSVSRGRERERSPSPEFASADAREFDARHRANSGDRVSRAKDSFLGRLAHHSSPASPTTPVYLDTSLEALNLETLIKPTLERMRPKLREAEEQLPALPALPTMPQHARGRSLQLPREAVLASPKRQRQPVLLSHAAPAVVVTPPPKRSDSSHSSSSSEERNPFELEFGGVAPLEITQMPKRPVLQRKAVSYRTQRELPLRVQAVRRSHQEQYARAILAKSQINREQMTRRASETAVPARPKPTPIQRDENLRSQSVSHMLSPPPQTPRSRSTSRSGSRTRHERMPSGPHRARAHETEDFYLLAAMSSWSFDP